jgi:hypothetical protein
MSFKAATVFTCDMCKSTDHGIEDCYDVPLEWMTIRMSKNVSASAADDLHICPNCKYNDLITLWDTI